MPRTPKQYEEIREERSKLIMDTALDLFATKGYHGTSINDIAIKAGISKGLLYNYFSGKEQLVIEIMKNGFLEFLELFDPNHDGVITKAEMRNVLSAIFKTAKEKAHFWRLYFAVITQPIVNQVAFAEIMEIAMPVLDMLSRYFESEGYKNPLAEARIFAAMMDGLTLSYVYDTENFPVDDVINRVKDMYNLNEK